MLRILNDINFLSFFCRQCSTSIAIKRRLKNSFYSNECWFYTIVSMELRSYADKIPKTNSSIAISPHHYKIYSYILHMLQTSIQWKVMNRDLVRLLRTRRRRRLRRVRMAAAHQDHAPSRLVRFLRPAVIHRQHPITMRWKHHTRRPMIRGQCRRHPIVQTMM